MSEESKDTILKQFQFPVAVFACLQAGSVFYLAIYFEHIKEKYKIEDEMFDMFDFWLNACALFGVIPGLILNKIDCKKSAILGGLMIVAGQVMTTVMVSTEHDKIKENPVLVLAGICFLSGQGSCLVLLSSMQALMNSQTIQASHVISTCCFAYYLGADSFIESVKEGSFANETFTNFTFSLSIVAFVLTVLNGIVITDEDDASGFFGKAAALTKGVVYKKTDYMHLFVLLVYTSVLLLGYFVGGLADESAAIILEICVLLNLGVPIFLLCLMDPNTIKALVGEPSDIEKKLSNKGVDKTFTVAAQRIDFWYCCIVAMFLIGIARIFDENADVLGMQKEGAETMISETYSVYEVIGAVSVGTFLTLFRSKIRPSLTIIICCIVGGLGQLAMIWPNQITMTEPMRIAVASASFAEGGLMVSLASFCHEEYGTEQIGVLLGIMMSFGAAGLYALDEVFFPNILTWFGKEDGAGIKGFVKYGEWNVFLFTNLAIIYFVCLILAMISHWSVTRREKADGQKLAMVKF